MHERQTDKQTGTEKDTERGGERQRQRRGNETLPFLLLLNKKNLYRSLPKTSKS